MPKKKSSKKPEEFMKNNPLAKLKVTYADIKDVRGNDYNPNRQSEHEFELLCKSIREDGFTQPIVCVVDKEKKAKYLVVDGEHRWRAADAIGMKRIPICVTNMTAEQARIATLRHNRARGSEDVHLAAMVIRSLDEDGATDYAMDSLMMDDVEFANMVRSVPDSEASIEFGDMGGYEDVPAVAELLENAKTGITGEDEVEEVVSQSAATKLREIEKKISEAKNEEEVVMATAESAVYRLSLFYSGEEAVIVKSVLGKKRSEKVLELCSKPSK